MTNSSYERTPEGYMRTQAGRVRRLEHRLPSVPLRQAATSYRGTTSQRNAIYGDPALLTNPEKVALAERQINWYNTTLGWEESYYVVTGLGAGVAELEAGTLSGWYPTGPGPAFMMEPSTAFAVTNNNYLGNWSGVVNQRGGADWFVYDSLSVQIVKAGRYDFGWWTNQQTGGGQADYHTRLLNAAGTVVDWMSNVGGEPLSASFYMRTGADYRNLHVRAGEKFAVLAVTGALNIHQVTVGGTTFPNTRGQMYVRYVGPALISD